MEKPVRHKREPIYDYHEIIRYIEDKYNINTDDYAGKHKEPDRFKEITGIDIHASPQSYGGKYYIQGKEITFKEYNDYIPIWRNNNKLYSDWYKTQPQLPYLDYWHWMLNNSFYEMSNGSEHYWNLTEIIEDEKNPEWIKEITQLVKDEFIEDELVVWVEW